MKKWIFAYFLLILPMLVMAQPGGKPQEPHWRKRLEEARALEEAGDYESSARAYERAWKDKRKKTELIYKAGQLYYKSRQYRKANNAFRHIKKDKKKYPMLGYEYGVALKQAQEYDASKKMLSLFSKNYRGADKVVMRARAVKQIEGCNLALKNMGVETEDIILEHMSSNINSSLMEYAPIPFSDDIFYYSSMVEGASKIYRARRIDGKWSEIIIPNTFERITAPHFGNGSFSSDKTRFYYTQCELDAENKAKCELYYMQHKGDWLDPKRLPDYINVEGTTNSAPCVVEVDGQEVVYFVSDREGGEGQRDIWYITRELGTEDFSIPINAGKIINSAGDEIAPFYEEETATLFFSSDEHIGFGGMDIFKAIGEKGDWEAPQNMGAPYNSYADDVYYIRGDWRKDKGFFTSNRLHGKEKKTTDDDDIFHFYPAQQMIEVRGNIHDAEETNRNINNTSVALYEVIGSGQKRLLNTQVFNNGGYMFELLPNRLYKIEAKKRGYHNAFVEIDTRKAKNQGNILQDIPLEFIKEKEPIVAQKSKGAKPVFDGKGRKTRKSRKQRREEEKAKKEVIVQTPPKKVTAYKPPVVTQKPPVRVQAQPPVSNPPVTTKRDESKLPPPLVITDEPIKPYRSSRSNRSSRSSRSKEKKEKYEKKEWVCNLPHTDRDSYGEVYRIQLLTIKVYKDYKYRKVAELGELTQDLTSSGMIQVMLGDFDTLEEAKAVLEKTLTRGFNNPHIIKFTDGKRKRIRF